MEVFLTPDGPQASWSQGIPNNHAGDLKMVTAWKELGFIKNNSDWTPTNLQAQYIQVERNDPTI